MSPPAVSESGARSDRDWFGDHPSRRFRVRPLEDDFRVVRKRRDALLRTFTRERLHLADRDKEIAPAWFAAGLPRRVPCQIRKERPQGHGRPPMTMITLPPRWCPTQPAEGRAGRGCNRMRPAEGRPRAEAEGRGVPSQARRRAL
jgi:hypothetical protein